MKYGQKIKLGDAYVTPKNIQEVQASKLGDALRHPFFIDKNLNVPLKESCVVFIIWEHNIVIFSFEALFGLTWRMLTPCLTLTSRHKPL
jgi:hypothetical protein